MNEIKNKRSGPGSLKSTVILTNPNGKNLTYEN